MELRTFTTCAPQTGTLTHAIITSVNTTSPTSGSVNITYAYDNGCGSVTQAFNFSFSQTKQLLLKEGNLTAITNSNNLPVAMLTGSTGNYGNIVPCPGIPVRLSFTGNIYRPSGHYSSTAIWRWYDSSGILQNASITGSTVTTITNATSLPSLDLQAVTAPAYQRTNWFLPNDPGGSVNNYTFQASKIILYCAPYFQCVSGSGVTAFTNSSISLSSFIASHGTSFITANGFVYGTSANPTLSNNVLSVTTIAGTSGYVTGTITGLTTGVVYYIRAFATNKEGTTYDKEYSQILGTVAIVGTTYFSNVTSSTVKPTSSIISAGGASDTSVGFQYSTDSFFSVYGTIPGIYDNSTAVEEGTGLPFFAYINSLAPSTTYYLRAYATNSFGTSFSDSTNFTTTAASSTYDLTYSATVSTLYGGDWFIYDNSAQQQLAASTDSGSGTISIPANHEIQISISGDGPGTVTSEIYDGTTQIGFGQAVGSANASVTFTITENMSSIILITTDNT